MKHNYHWTDFIEFFVIAILLLSNVALAQQHEVIFSCTGYEQEVSCNMECLRFNDVTGIGCDKRKQYNCMERCIKNKRQVPCLKKCEYKAYCDKKTIALLYATKPVLNCEGKQ